MIIVLIIVSRGHVTNKCMKLKHLVQDLVDQGKIDVDPTAGKSPNANLAMYKDALPKHQGEASMSNASQSRTTNNISYNKVSFDYGGMIGCLTQVE